MRPSRSARRAYADPAAAAWYEWYPDYAYDFSGISFSPGDSVTLTVTASSTTSGTAVITNYSKGKTVTKQITSRSALCEQDAEWIVEDFSSGGLVPFANFGKVTFTDATGHERHTATSQHREHRRACRLDTHRDRPG